MRRGKIEIDEEKGRKGRGEAYRRLAVIRWERGGGIEERLGQPEPKTKDWFSLFHEGDTRKRGSQRKRSFDPTTRSYTLL